MPVDTGFLGKSNASINEQLLSAQQRLAYAKALQDQSLQPIQAPSGQNGRISPLSVLAQALNGYTSKDMMGTATHDFAQAQAAQAQNQMAMMAKMLNPDGDQPSAPPAPASAPPAAGATAPAQDPGPALFSTPQASVPGAGAPTVAAGSGAASGPATPAPGGAAPFAAQDPRTDPRYRQMAMAEQLGVLPQGTAAAYAKAKYDYGAPTEQMKTDTWAGVTPAQRATITNSFTLSPNQTRGQVGADGKPVTAMVGADPDNNLQYSVDPDGKVTASGVAGAPKALAAMAGAKAKAAADAGVVMVTLPTGETVPMRAGPAAAAGGAQAGLAPPTYTGNKLSPQDLARLQAGAAKGDPDAKAALAAYQQAQPRLGQPTGAKESVEGMSKKWEDLAANNGSAQQAISFLSNIKQLADKAITGTASDKISFANGLLSQLGISDRATDAKTATDLLDKNSNRLAALLGQGSLTTDAARAISAAANPNGKMSKDAIKEAADDIIGQYRMTQAKANVLLPYRNANDAPGYNSAETKFNQVADPRVWRLQSMNPQDAATYIKRMAPADAADLLRRRTEIMKNGWLQ